MTPYKVFSTGSNVVSDMSGGSDQNNVPVSGSEAENQDTGNWFQRLGQEFYDRTTRSTQDALNGAYNLKELFKGNVTPIAGSLKEVMQGSKDGVGHSGSSIDSDNPSLDPSGYDQAMWAYERQLDLDEMERKYNSEEAQKQRDWEERMSNSSYQRAVADLKAAGLNPWLAVQNGGNGASTPSGAAASASSGSSKVPNPAIYKAILQLVASLVSSSTSVIGAIAKAF